MGMAHEQTTTKTTYKNIEIGIGAALAVVVGIIALYIGVLIALYFGIGSQIGDTKKELMHWR